MPGPVEPRSRRHTGHGQPSHSCRQPLRRLAADTWRRGACTHAPSGRTGNPAARRQRATRTRLRTTPEQHGGGMCSHANTQAAAGTRRPATGQTRGRGQTRDAVDRRHACEGPDARGPATHMQRPPQLLASTCGIGMRHASATIKLTRVCGRARTRESGPRVAEQRAAQRRARRCKRSGDEMGVAHDRGATNHDLQRELPHDNECGRLQGG